MDQRARAYADFSRTPGGFRRPTPDLWEHTSDVLGEFGLGEDQVGELIATGAVF